MNSNQTTRRGFLTLGTRSAALLGLGSLGARANNAPTGKPTAIVSFPTGARQARGIAVDEQDRILVAADRSIRVFLPEGTPSATINLSAEPICLAARHAQVVVGFRDHVEWLSPTGQRRATSPTLPGTPALASLAVAENGEVFAADGGNRVIWRFASDGRSMSRLDREGREFSVPHDFFPILTDGHQLVVANLGRHRIETITARGVVVSAWGNRTRGLEGFGGCCNPISLARTPSGDFITAEGGLPRIKRFDAAGRFKELLAGPEQLEANARGSHETSPGLSHNCHSGGLELAVDSTERVLVLDRVTAEVRVIQHA